jgi:hypothetical protein
MSSLQNWETALACLCIIFWDMLQSSGELKRPNLEELQNDKETQISIEPCSFRVENRSTHDVDSQHSVSNRLVLQCVGVIILGRPHISGYGKLEVG